MEQSVLPSHDEASSHRIHSGQPHTRRTPSFSVRLRTRSILASIVAAALLTALIALGSRGFHWFDATLIGYAVATIFATAAVTYKYAFWLARPPTGRYWRRSWRLFLSYANFRHYTLLIPGAIFDLFMQQFIRRRGWYRWVTHQCIFWGVILSCYITFPLTFGWIRLTQTATGQHLIWFFGFALFAFPVDSVLGFLIYHALDWTTLPLLIGLVLAFHRRFHDLALLSVQRFGFDIIPLALLMAIAVTGLALTADSTWLGGAYYWYISLTHETVVVLWLISLPFGKFFHLIERPATVGIELYWKTGEDTEMQRCARCGEEFAPVRFIQDLKKTLSDVGEHYTLRKTPAVEPRSASTGTRASAQAASQLWWQDLCPACKRVMRAQANLAALGRGGNQFLCWNREQCCSSGRERQMSVDKGIFRRRQRQQETFDFHSGEVAPTHWRSDEEIERYVPTHCCYCGVQCGMYLKVANGKVVGVEPREDFPLNHGMLCPKGATAYQTVNHPDRLLYPLMRRHGKDSPLERASWDEVLDTIVERFRTIQGQYGKDAVAIFSGSSMTNEKCYIMGKFARVALGTRHTDYNGRLCMSSATGANERSLGIDRAANPVSDMLHAECIFVIGANVGECFPIITSYLWQARDRGCKLIVADPRQTPIARTADLFLPLRSGTDSALLNGMLHVVINEGLLDEDFIRERTVGWEETRAMVAQYPPERVARVCGLRPEVIIEAAHLYGHAKAALVYTARGLEHQSKGVDNGVAAANLALATGNFGRPGAGYGTLTGQGNGQGGREVGQKASQLPGCREIEDPEDRAYICSVWGIDEHNLPHAGYPATLMIPAMLRKEIRACYMLCSNPMVSLPDQHTAERALRGLDLFVVNDFFLSETAELADIVLPGTTWAEDEGTTTSLEGRVIKYNKAVDPPGEARTDWQIACELARRLGKGQYVSFRSPREIFDELRLCTGGRSRTTGALPTRRSRRRTASSGPVRQKTIPARRACMKSASASPMAGRVSTHWHRVNHLSTCHSQQKRGKSFQNDGLPTKGRSSNA